MQRKPRMLQICSVDFTVAHLLQPLIDYCSHDYEVEIACAPGVYSRKMEEEGYRFQYVPFSRGLNPISHVRAILALVSLLRTRRYDVIHTHTPIAGILGRLAGVICGVPVIVNTVHGFFFHEHSHPTTRFLFTQLERFLGQRTQFSFFQSKEDYDVALRLGVCSATTGLFIGNGVDQERFSPHRSDLGPAAQELREQLGIPESHVAIGMVARLVREKGVLELLEAFRYVCQKYHNVHLVLVGDALNSDRDGVRSTLLNALNEKSLQGRIHWLGFRSDVDVVLKAIDVFVLPSYREGMPRSIIEAMSMALPVVATNIRGCREEVIDGVTGLLVPRMDADALGHALSRMVEDPKFRRAMGQAGLERAMGLYNEWTVLELQGRVFATLTRREG